MWKGFGSFLLSGLHYKLFSSVLNNFFPLCVYTFIGDQSDTILILCFYSSNSPRKPGAQCDLHAMEVAKRS